MEQMRELVRLETAGLSGETTRAAILFADKIFGEIMQDLSEHH
ncbi:hypothetical protein N177_3101 [Lutibaculum baratangense AMV1]|uniref:Uncharacterized protein n=2 Tax=Lutibaculum TaxID=1358438 RepID=V4T916_9HYPH|nr:hypothetical protein N177_3101 [Lutibaculum baratangense AMV1]